MASNWQVTARLVSRISDGAEFRATHDIESRNSIKDGRQREREEEGGGSGADAAGAEGAACSSTTFLPLSTPTDV